MSAQLSARQQIHFLSLQTAIFCAQCELISANVTPCCMACGSKAVLSLSRLFGGSLRSQPAARLIEDQELDRLVRELLSVPSLQDFPGSGEYSQLHANLHAYASCGESDSAHDIELAPTMARPMLAESLTLEPAIAAIAERAQTLTGATGAAIALRKGNEIICRARAGRTAPDLGVRLQTNSGVSAECLRRGETVLCNDAEDDPQVDLASCRRLGVRSILAAPLRQSQNTVGIFEVLSAVPHAFNYQDVATMQLLSITMVAAITRLSSIG